MAFEFTDSNFTEKTAEGVVLVDFWATWCGPCRAIAPTIEELYSDYKDKALVGKLDVDHNPEVAMKYGIRSIPTLLILKDGKVVHQHVGLATKQVLANKLDALVETTV
ncbi:thioredoxin [Haliscomenobacter hydrossis]|uniref:Thioredoxin n=1 Tax=Haliscomenobacter hydrossis (strain ATCC 27775 / DSM 1100 / LMG 10767 / O) TaxID=760192 RepID=F4KVZ2_HALH1|nr:thioredoxin [Haliscomenobacter hydrossis]AEE48190.1 thioredoxin [Haliscomenobacter hydrossis DSM 1100]